jgi:hypothetical protein
MKSSPSATSEFTGLTGLNPKGFFLKPVNPEKSC